MTFLVCHKQLLSGSQMRHKCRKSPCKLFCASFLIGLKFKAAFWLEVLLSLYLRHAVWFHQIASFLSLWLVLSGGREIAQIHSYRINIHGLFLILIVVPVHFTRVILCCVCMCVCVFCVVRLSASCALVRVFFSDRVYNSRAQRD